MELQKRIEEFKAENPDGLVIVHVGPGNPRKWHHPIGEKELHICFELFKEHEKEYRKLAKKDGNLAERVVWITGPFASEADYLFESAAQVQQEKKLTKPPKIASKKLPNGVVDEIHAHDVFSFGPCVQTIKNVLAEAGRVLKPDGNLIVSNSATVNSCPPIYFKTTAEKRGWNIEYEVEPGGETYSPADIAAFQKRTGKLFPAESRNKFDFLARLTKNK